MKQLLLRLFKKYFKYAAILTVFSLLALTILQDTIRNSKKNGYEQPYQTVPATLQKSAYILNRYNASVVKTSKSANESHMESGHSNISRKTYIDANTSKHQYSVAEKRVLKYYQRCKESIQWKNNSGLTGRITQGLVSDKFKIVLYIKHKASSFQWFQLLAVNNMQSPVPQKELDAISALPHYRYGMLKYDIFQSDLYVEDKLRMLRNDYFSVVTVMHPLLRLETVYRENMADINSYWCRTYDEKIIARFRKNLGAENIQLSEKIQECITFEEFVQFLTMNYPTEPHWAPYVDKRAVFPNCDTKINYIAKSETLAADMKYISHQHLAGLATDISTGHTVKLPKILTLFSSLKKADFYIKMLLHWYKHDMNLFGYSYSITNGTVTAECQEYIDDECV